MVENKKVLKKPNYTIEASFVDADYIDINISKTGKPGSSFQYHIRVNDTEISCGVLQAHYLPIDKELAKMISDFPTTYCKILKETYIKVLNLIKTGDKDNDIDGCAFVVLSNNNDKAYSIINKVLNTICLTKTGFRKNPNSGNQIKTFIY